MRRLLPINHRVLFVILTSGCGTGTWIATFEGIDLVKDGIDSSRFSDGCSLQIDSLPVVIHQASVVNTAYSPIAQTTFNNTMFDAAYDVPVVLGQEEIIAYPYNRHSMTIAPGIATEFGEGMDPVFGANFDSVNGSIGLFGTLECGTDQVELAWAFSQTIDVICDYNYRVPKDGEAIAAYELDPRPLFRMSSLDDEIETIAGQAIIDADADGDGVVQLFELSEVPLSTLDGYADDPTDRVDTLYQLIEYNTERMILLDGTRCTPQIR